MRAHRRQDTPALVLHRQPLFPVLSVKIFPWRCRPSMLSGGGVPKKFICVPKSILFDDGWTKVTQVFLCAYQDVGTDQIHHGELLGQDFLHSVIYLFSLLIIRSEERRVG